MVLDIQAQDLSKYCTLGIGCVAQRFVAVNDLESLKEAIKHAKTENIPYFILGGGSNMLINDEAFEGLVIHLQMADIQFLDKHRVEVDAGANWDDVVVGTCERNWGGLEAMSGIPGSCGGGVVQNIGAYGQEISEVIEFIDILEPSDLSVKRIGAKDMEFSYRHSRLKGQVQGPIVLRVGLQLAPYDAQAAKARSEAHGFRSLAMMDMRNASQLRKHVLNTRQSKGMVYDSADVNTHGVGSFFTNPIVPEMDASRLSAQYVWRSHVSAIGGLKDNKAQTIPMFPVEGGVKLSAAWLIEQCGYERGYMSGRAGLSQKHCLAITNRGGASCAEVITLASAIARKVRDKFRVLLNPEALYLGTRGIEPMPLDLDSHRESSGADNIGLKI
ncbi:MAG: UDP-N-acetylmuramate dehydrogenase [Bradymonadales bacterium]|jgi:UDP-N-acetylmuramate dehydrogenase